MHYFYELKSRYFFGLYLFNLNLCKLLFINLLSCLLSITKHGLHYNLKICMTLF